MCIRDRACAASRHAVDQLQQASARLPRQGQKDGAKDASETTAPPHPVRGAPSGQAGAARLMQRNMPSAALASTFRE
eukprot:12895229-Alexandrium_andersonii.AAC.1